MKPDHLYFAMLGASIALSLVGILIVLRDVEMQPELRWSCVGLFGAGAVHALFFGPWGKDLADGLCPVLVLLSAAGVVLLWSIVRLLFDDHFTARDARTVPVAVIVLGLGVPVAVAWLLPQFRSVAMPGMAVLCAALALHMLWILMVGRTDDLDSYRRWLRALLAGGGSLYVVLVLAAHFLGMLQGRPIAGAIGLAFGQVAIKVAWLLLVLGAPSPMTRVYRITHAGSPSPLVPLSVVGPTPAHPEPGQQAAAVETGTSAVEPASTAMQTASTTQPMPKVSEAMALRQAMAILDAMEKDKLYRQPGLSIGKLAEHLRMPEHRVRALINGHLQFRNYTAFLNHFRLAEAAHRLRDPEQAHLPILSIALDVGYASIAPFNRAFRDAFGQTPSDYRHGRSPAQRGPTDGR